MNGDAYYRHLRCARSSVGRRSTVDIVEPSKFLPTRPKLVKDFIGGIVNRAARDGREVVSFC